MFLLLLTDLLTIKSIQTLIAEIPTQGPCFKHKAYPNQLSSSTPPGKCRKGGGSSAGLWGSTDTLTKLEQCEGCGAARRAVLRTEEPKGAVVPQFNGARARVTRDTAKATVSLSSFALVITGKVRPWPLGAL